MNALTQNMDLQKQLDFILEADKLKQIFRRTVLTDGSRRENDAEHSWHLALAAMIFAPYADKEVNLSRVLQMVTLHDIIEIDAGDTFAYDAKANRDKAAREQKAADRIFGMLPQEQGSAFRALWEEFDAMETPDAQFANALDRLQPLLHNFVTNGHTWKEGAIDSSMVRTRMQPIQTGLPKLWPVVEEIIQQSIRRGYLPK